MFLSTGLTSSQNFKYRFVRTCEDQLNITTAPKLDYDTVIASRGSIEGIKVATILPQPFLKERVQFAWSKRVKLLAKIRWEDITGRFKDGRCRGAPHRSKYSFCVGSPL